jgi:hypothetical protein
VFNSVEEFGTNDSAAAKGQVKMRNGNQVSCNASLRVNVFNLRILHDHRDSLRSNASLLSEDL